MGEKIEYDPKIGPALALLTAVNDGNVRTVYTAVQIAGPQQLTDSCCELVRRMILNAELNIETGDLQLVFHWASDEKNAWRPIVIRRRDWFSWSPARRLGLYFVGSILHHYIEQGGGTEEEWESGEFEVPPGLRLNLGAMKGLTAREWALGLAYGMSIIAEAIADYDEADLDERIKAYRAWAATQMLAPTA